MTIIERLKRLLYLFAWRREVNRVLRILAPGHVPTAVLTTREIEEEPDPQTRRKELGDLFLGLRQQVRSEAQTQREEALATCRDRIAKHKRKILPPDIPGGCITVDGDKLAEKAKARWNADTLKEEIGAYPEISAGHRRMAMLLLLLSLLANWMTVTQFLGADWLGNESMSVAATASVALLLTVAELVGFGLVTVFVPDQFKLFIMKGIGVLGAVSLLLGLLLLILGRSELGSAVTQTPLGIVQ